jgi:putative aldouronate transport system permease protein
MKSNKYHFSPSYRVFLFCNYVFMVGIAFITILPFLYVLTISLMSQSGLSKYGFVIFPREIDFSNYRYIINNDIDVFAAAYKNTLFITGMGTFLNVVATSTLAYPLSKKNLPYRNAITLFVFVTMLFGGGLIPTYLVVKGTGLLDSLWSLIIPQLINAWNMLLLRNFFMTIPDSLEESAQIDGCTVWRILFNIIIPLSMPAITTIALFYAVDHWNDWFSASIYITSRDKKPLMYYLREVLMTAKAQEIVTSSQSAMNTQIPSEGIKNASIIITIAPIIMVYPFIQKYFVKGILIGSIKG